jgi:uncharacterized protein (DUF4415 family)
MKKPDKHIVRMAKSEMKPLSKKQLGNLRKLSMLPESEIDFSEIPEIKELPSDHVIGKFYRPKKTSVSIRLDSDVLAWLKTTGEGYQTRINTYLRQLMRRNIREHSKSAG